MVGRAELTKAVRCYCRGREVAWMLVYEVGEGWGDYGSRLVQFDFGDLGLILGGCMVLGCKWVSWV